MSEFLNSITNLIMGILEYCISYESSIVVMAILFVIVALGIMK